MARIVLWIVGVAAALTVVNCGSDPPAVREKIVTTPTLSPEVDAVLMAHQLAPDESLSVRLLGTIGPHGGYTLKDVPVSRSGEKVFIMPNVRKTEGQNFIQMVMPLDHTLRLSLPPGRHTVQVFAKQGTLTEEVVVDAKAVRPPPKTTIEVGPSVQVGDETRINLTVVGEPGDGYIDYIEAREVHDGSAGPWQRLEALQRTSGLLRCWSQRVVRAGVQLEARAIDGQGIADPTPAQVELRETP